MTKEENIEIGEAAKLITKTEAKKLTLSEKLLILDLVILDSMAAMCSSVQMTFMSRLVLQRGGNFIIAALLQTSQYVVMGLLSTAVGKYIGRFGYKKTLMFGVLVEGLSIASFSFLHFINDIRIFSMVGIALRLISGLGLTISITSIFAIAGGLLKHRSELVFGLLEAALGVSTILGPIVGAFLYNASGNMFVPIIIPSVLYLVSSFRFAFWFKDESKFEGVQIRIRDIFAMIAHVDILLPIVTLFLIKGLSCYIYVTLTVYFKLGHISVVQTGWYVVILAICYAVTAPATGKLNSWAPRVTKFTLFVGYFGMVLSVLFFIGDYRRWLIITGLIIYGVFHALFTISAYNQSMQKIISENPQVPEAIASSSISSIWVMFGSWGRFLYSLLACVVLNFNVHITQVNLYITFFNTAFGIVLVVIYFIHYFVKRK